MTSLIRSLCRPARLYDLFIGVVCLSVWTWCWYAIACGGKP